MEDFEKHNAVPVWGGVECTIHRIGNHYGNQLQRNGHLYREDDLALIKSLGIRTLRYPVLWEMIAPDGIKNANWTWTDKRMAELQKLGLNPIVSLLHHGSGPLNTSLLDPKFPEKFTEFAIAVAERYPWVEMFTPINEPLTTARFSCLYGHWYPHARHNYAFGRALVNECKATVMAMTEVRKIIPNSKLIQTEDLGRCYATPKLQYQADLENERRWCSLDLLTGRGLANKFVQKFFLDTSLLDDDLLYLTSHVCKPDIIGINHYITSERFLDHRYHRHPKWAWGSNGQDRYADIEVVRADISKRAGHYAILKETYERYRLPVSFTEVHMGATREEQLRWFMEAWKAVVKLKSEGLDVRGITAWSMFGAFDWNTLLTRENNFYESGIFDVRSGNPRKTALGALIEKLTQGETPQHPLLQVDGWWKNPGVADVIFERKQSVHQLPPVEELKSHLPTTPCKPVLITGATGTLGKAFARICKIRNISYVMLSREEMDIADRESVQNVFRKYEPWAVINAAGFVRVDEAELEPQRCLRENTEGAATLGYTCRKYDAQYLTFSTDMVFNGAQQTPYLETDSAQPLNIYGVSKFLAEGRVTNVLPTSLIIRTSSFFGPWDEYNFLSNMIRSLQDGRIFKTSNQIISPTYVPDLVNSCLDLLIDKESGIWHIAHPSEISWQRFACITAEMLGLNTGLIKVTNDQNELGHRAPRPAYSALISSRGCLMPELESGIRRFLNERQIRMVA